MVEMSKCIIAGNVDRKREDTSGDVDTLDRAGIHGPAKDGIAGPAVRVLPDPAWTEHVAGTDFEQPAGDVVLHRHQRAVRRPGLPHADRCRQGLAGADLHLEERGQGDRPDHPPDQALVDRAPRDPSRSALGRADRVEEP